MMGSITKTSTQLIFEVAFIFEAIFIFEVILIFEVAIIFEFWTSTFWAILIFNCSSN